MPEYLPCLVTLSDKCHNVFRLQSMADFLWNSLNLLRTKCRGLYKNELYIGNLFYTLCMIAFLKHTMSIIFIHTIILSTLKTNELSLNKTNFA